VQAQVERPDAVGLLAQLPKELRGVWITWATVVSINLLIWFVITLANVGNIG